MNRLIGLGHSPPPAHPPGAGLALAIPITAGMTRLHYESNYINAFKPHTRVVRDYHMVESRLGGIGLVEVVVPIPPGRALEEGTLGKLREVERAIAAIPRGETPAVAPVLSLATVLDPDGVIAALSPEARARVLAAKLDLIAATPQAELLAGFWNPKTGRSRVLVRLLEQQPAPAKVGIFRQSLAAARERFGTDSYLTGLSFLLTRTTEAIIVTQWATILTSSLGSWRCSSWRSGGSRWRSWPSCRHSWRSASCSA
jgi:hypothetical protein